MRLIDCIIKRCASVNDLDPRLDKKRLKEGVAQFYLFKSFTRNRMRHVTRLKRKQFCTKPVHSLIVLLRENATTTLYSNQKLIVRKKVGTRFLY